MHVILYWTRIPWGKNKEGWCVITDGGEGATLAIFGSTITEEQAKAACAAMGLIVDEVAGK